MENSRVQNSFACAEKSIIGTPIVEGGFSNFPPCPKLNMMYVEDDKLH
jgi:hypothetical protein